MTNLYLQGMTSTPSQINRIESDFEQDGLTVTNLDINYNALAFKPKKEIEQTLENAIGNQSDGEVNLICHSMGCNLGVLAMASSQKINKLVLISPSFEATESVNKKHGLSHLSMIKNLRKAILFLRTSDLTGEYLTELKRKILILYSNEDPSIFKDYLELLEALETLEVKSLPSKEHNPLLDENVNGKARKLIRNFITNN